MCGGFVRRELGERHTNSCHRFLPPQNPHPPRSPPERAPQPPSVLSARPYFFSYYLVYTSIRPRAFFHSTRMACWRQHLFAIALTHASHPNLSTTRRTSLARNLLFLTRDLFVHQMLDVAA